jgi:phage terminase small subunit
MPALPNPRHEAFAQALARGKNATAAHEEAGYKPNRSTACQLKQDPRISTRVAELQEEQLALHQQATVEAAANAKVTIESLIAEAEAARSKAMSEKGGAAAVSALTAKAKLAGMWREKVDTHNTGSPVYQRIERTIIEHHPTATPDTADADYQEPPTNGRHWSKDNPRALIGDVANEAVRPVATVVEVNTAAKAALLTC